MKVVVLTGPESSGKSWLAKLIKEQFAAVVVGEYVRYFIEQENRDTSYADITPIALGQLGWEDAARAQQPELLVLDTHLLSNILWSKTLFGQVPEWIEPALLDRHYDLHLLLSPEGVAWCDDGMRCQPNLTARQLFYKDCKSWLDTHNKIYLPLSGNWAMRQQGALNAVAALLNQ